MRALTTGELKTSVETRERSARALASAPTKSPALLGEGGMGKVWRAHHSGLKRDDALKVLPDAFAAEPDRLARFRREAQVLASLNHPNIAHVYGMEQSDDVQALVMELVEGPTLADRITQGPIPIDEALPIAKQIAEALEGAHERGIILVSWADLCLRLHESAGKRHSTRTRPGNPWLKTTLVQVAWVAARTRNTYLRAQFLRLKSRGGSKKAIIAVAASILTAAYYILRDRTTYHELGPDYLDRRRKAQLTRRLIRRLEDLGLSVEVRPAA